jgi:hypothetical protein
MKTVLAVLFIIVCAGVVQAQTVQCLTAGATQGWGACPFVQPVVTAQAVNSKVSAAAGTTITNAFGSATTAGNSILCVGFEGVAAIPVFTDAQSNTYIVAASSGAAAPGYTIALASNIVGGTTDTVTLTTSSGSASFSCYELKGSVNVGQIWDFASGIQATSATLAFTQTSASIANDFVVVAAGMGAGTINATPSIAGVPSTLSTVDQSNTAPLSGGSTPALSVFYSAHANVSNSPTFTQVMSLSASETYSAVLVGVKPFSISLVGNVQDPCQQGAGISGNISLTANTQLITGVAGKQTYICGLNLITATTQNVALVEGTGSTCATNTLGMAGGTTAATGWNFAANGGLVNGGGGFWVYKTATAGDNICLFISASGQTSGSFRYVQQ